MPRQEDRVTPAAEPGHPGGELIAVPDRGMFWGNRGVLHDPEGRLVRYSRGRAWAICVLEYKGRRRKQWAPGRLTELFFLDEATALAAGHRPCGECRYRDYQAFKARGRLAHGGERPGRSGDRRALARRPADRAGDPAHYRAPLGELPDGAMAELDGAPWPRATAAASWPGRREATATGGRPGPRR